MTVTSLTNWIHIPPQVTNNADELSQDDSPETTDSITESTSAIINHTNLSITSPVDSYYYLSNIIIVGFKSYSHKVPQVISLLPSLNCIVGVNGSGKSNIIEAICFVCGYKSASLRTSKLKDLSFNGIRKPVSVYIEFCHRQTHEPVVSIGRQINNGSSSYSVCHPSNGAFSYADSKKITTEETAELFKQVGLDISVPERWICRQQDTIALVRYSPVGFMNLVEKIAGIAPLMEFQKELVSDLVKVEEDLVKCNDDQDQLTSIIQETEQSYKIYKEFKSLENEVSNLRELRNRIMIEQFQLQLSKKQMESEKCQSNLMKLRDEFDVLEKTINKQESLKSKIQPKIDRLQKEIQEKKSMKNTLSSSTIKQEVSLTQLQTQLKQCTGSIKTQKE
ncbi:hypothetical protein GEMRC1_002377 [Eukaryota sp. GEM-RC1]